MSSVPFKKGVPVFLRPTSSKSETLKLVVLFILLFLVSLNLLTLVFYQKEPQLSPYSEAFDGLSEMRADLERFNNNLSTIYSTMDVLESVDDPEGSVVLIIGPEKDITSSEAASLKDFVQNGGSIILADDTGKFSEKLMKELFQPSALLTEDVDNPLLEVLFGGERFSHSYNIDPTRVRDMSYERSPEFLVETAYLGNREYEIMFNAPASLDIIKKSNNKPADLEDTYEFDLVCSTSDFAWKDENMNYKRDKQEYSGHIPLIVQVPYLESWLEFESNPGTIFLVSDPGIFINDMWHRGQNRMFCLDMINSSYDRDNGFIFLDTSKHFQDSFIQNSGQAAISFSVLTASSRYTFVFWVGLLIAAIFVLMKVKNLKKYNSITLVNYPWLGRFRNPFLSKADYLWMRSVYLEKVRILSGYTKDEFYTLNREELEALIYDPVIIRFLFDSPDPPPEFYRETKKVNYYEDVGRRMGKWRPRGGGS